MFLELLLLSICKQVAEQQFIPATAAIRAARDRNPAFNYFLYLIKYLFNRSIFRGRYSFLFNIFVVVVFVGIDCKKIGVVWFYSVNLFNLNVKNIIYFINIDKIFKS
jgi:hypothetical protein